MNLSPPIRFRIEWAGRQGKVTASWQSAHFNFPRTLPPINIILPATSSLAPLQLRIDEKLTIA